MEWAVIGQQFQAEIAPSARFMKLSILLSIPLATAWLCLALTVPIVGRLFDWLDQLVPNLPLLLVTPGLSLLGMAVHVLSVQHAVDAVDRQLATRDRYEQAFVPRSATLNIFEVLGLWFFGPHLLVQLIGTVRPQTLRNTPMTGMHCDWSTAVAVVIFAVLLYLRMRDRAYRESSPESAPESSAAFDVVARLNRAK